MNEFIFQFWGMSLAAKDTVALFLAVPLGLILAAIAWRIAFKKSA